MDLKHLNFCKVALYTGCRIGEIISLKKEFINLEDNTIYIFDGKNKFAPRTIPINKNILEIIKNQLNNNTEYLFFDGNNNAIGKRVNSRLSKIIPNKNKTFHGLRKNFCQDIELNNENLEEKYKKYIFGHSLKKDISHSIYNRGKINIEKLENCIFTLTYKCI